MDIGLFGGGVTDIIILPMKVCFSLGYPLALGGCLNTPSDTTVFTSGGFIYGSG